MAKRFMYVSIGVLCLVTAYQVGAERAEAEWNSETPGQLVGMTSSGSNVYVFSRSGAAWNATNDAGWLGPSPWLDLPVPIEDVALLDDSAIITKDDVLWMHVGDHWVDHGPFPGGPVAMDEESWGKVKAAHR